MTLPTGCHTVEPPPARERVDIVLSHLDRLATLPAAAIRLLAVASSAGRSRPAFAGDIVDIIESDPALTAAVFRLVRRADRGVRGATMTVKRAVALMGVSPVRNALLSIQLYETLSDPGDAVWHRFSTGGSRRGKTGATKELWRHNLAVACAAELIAEELETPGVNGEAFVCGLLHDMGKLALDACLPKAYARVVERVNRRFTCICDVEQEIIGLDHTMAGKHLAQRWSLPQPIVDCVWLHHQSPDSLPASVTSKPLVQIVHLADALVRRAQIGYSGYRDVEGFESLANRTTVAGGLDAARWDRIRDRLPQRMALYSESLGLDESRSRREVSASQHAASRQVSLRYEKLASRNRRLEIRSTCLSALEEFTRRVGKHDGISDVCVAAAQSLRIALGARQVVVLAYARTSRCIHVGECDSHDRTNASVVHPSDAGDMAVLEGHLSCARANVLLPAGEDLRVIWQRCTGSQPLQPLWMLRLAVKGEGTGVILLTATEESSASFGDSQDACGVLSAAVATALSTAGARIEAERLSEELADLNRRFGAGQEKLAQSRSISMIAALAAGTAHELNNPLSVISGRAQMGLADCDDADTARTLQIIIDETARASGIVTDLMNFAKPAAPQPQLQSLREVLESLHQHWGRALPVGSTSISIRLADPEQTVYADPAQLFEILDAVTTNAVEACRDKSARVQINSPSRPSDETVRIVVQDDGVGMTHEVLERAIDPFFSDRAAGRGRGLGLSLAFRLAGLNGGRLWLESEPGQGSTVTIELPARSPASGA